MTDSTTTVTKPLSTSDEYCEDDCVSTAVVEAVAEADGISSLEVRPPLYSAIDPDALDQLFAASGRKRKADTRADSDLPASETDRTRTQLSFAYAGYDVTVTGGDDVSISIFEK